MIVREYWDSGYKYFSIDLGDGEARMCLSSCRSSNINPSSYGVFDVPDGKVFYVEFIKVSPKHRNMGYGSKLLEASLRWANISKNVIILDAIPIDSGVDQNRLIRFYLTRGFNKPIGGKNRYAMYYNSRNRKVDKRQVVELIRKECEANGVKLRLGRGRNVKSGKLMCSGFFDDTVPELAVAMGREDSLPILIHEYNHMMQWKEDCPVWRDCGSSCEMLDAWIEGETFDAETINRAIDRIIDIELDCEKRTVEFITSSGIDIDVSEYTKKSNAYILFYNMIRDTRKWYSSDKKPYDVKEVWSKMPDKFGEENYTITPEQRQLYLKFCLPIGGEYATK